MCVRAYYGRKRIQPQARNVKMWIENIENVVVLGMVFMFLFAVAIGSSWADYIRNEKIHLSMDTIPMGANRIWPSRWLWWTKRRTIVQWSNCIRGNR